MTRGSDVAHCAALTLVFLTITIRAGAQPAIALADADGDRIADLTVFRPNGANWFIRYSRSGYVTNTVTQWGLPGDVPVPGDYDGDRRMDLAVYRPPTGVW
jgi:hypothetical protein